MIALFIFHVICMFAQFQYEQIVSIPDSFNLPTEKVEETIRQITLDGNGYERGLQHGRSLTKEINEIVAKWKDNAATKNQSADEVIKDFLEYAEFEHVIKQWTPGLWEEIRGIADGAGQSFQDILVLNLLDEFWVYKMAINMHHCSSLGVPAIGDRRSYIAQNMDIESYTQGHQILFRIARSAEHPEQLILSHPGLIALNGMNESGIGVVVNTLMQLKARHDGLPVAFVVRRIIASEDKDDILDFIKTVKHASGQNYMIGIKGEIVDFEASANSVIRFNPKNENGTVYHTNHPLVNDDIKDLFKKLKVKLFIWYYTLKGKDNSKIRLHAVKSRIKNNENIDIQTIKEVLRSKDNEAHPVCLPYSEDSGSFTFASTIMTLTRQPCLELTFDSPDKSAYKKVHFSKVKLDKTNSRQAKTEVDLDLK